MARPSRRALIAIAAAVIAVPSGGCGADRPPATAQAPQGTARARDGRPPTTVPDVVGMPFDPAVRRLHEAGLRQNSPGYPGSYSSTAMNGCIGVLSQAPRAGARVPRGTTIAVTLGLARC